MVARAVPCAPAEDPITRPPASARPAGASQTARRRQPDDLLICFCMLLFSSPSGPGAHSAGIWLAGMDRVFIRPGSRSCLRRAQTGIAWDLQTLDRRGMAGILIHVDQHPAQLCLTLGEDRK